MSIRSIPYAGKRELPTIGPHCALPVAEFARFGCGKTATRPSDESFYKDSIIGLSFLKFDKIIPCPKKDVSSATHTKQALVKPRDRTSTLPTPDAWKQSHDRSGAVCSERYAVLAGLKIYQISFFGTNTPPAFPDGQRKQR